MSIAWLPPSPRRMSPSKQAALMRAWSEARSASPPIAPDFLARIEELEQQARDERLMSGDVENGLLVVDLPTALHLVTHQLEAINDALESISVILVDLHASTVAPGEDS